MKRLSALVVSLLIMAIPAAALSEGRNGPIQVAGIKDIPFQDTGQLATARRTRGDVRLLKDSVHVSGRLAGVGRFRIHLDTQKFMNFIDQDPGRQEPILLQGYGVFYSKADGSLDVPVSALAYRSSRGFVTLKLVYVDRGAGRRPSHGIRMRRLQIVISDTQEVESVHFLRSRNSKADRHCLSDKSSLPSIKGIPRKKNLNTNEVFKQISILVEADQEWAQQVGDVQNSLTEMMNIVDTWYKRDLGISFSSTIVATAQSYTSSIVLDNNFEFPLHHEMQQKRPASDRSEYIHYLATGKRGSGDLQDLAGVVPDLGTICRNKSNSIGFSIYFPGDDTFVYVTTAHEIGHLFNAEHDDNSTGNTGFIMHSGTSDVNTFVNEFSNTSKQQVGTHVGQFGSCFSDIDAPNPGDDSGDGDDGDDGDDVDNSGAYVFAKNLRGKRKRVKLPRRGLLFNNRPARRALVALYCNQNLIRTKRTRRKGNVTVKIPRSLGRVSCYLQAPDGVQSNTVQAGKPQATIPDDDFPDDDFPDDGFPDDGFPDDDFPDDGFPDDDFPEDFF